MVAMVGSGVSAGTTASSDKASFVSSLQNRLQKMVLSWDYLRLLSEIKVNTQKRKKEGTDSLRSVPLTFTDVNDYLSVFEPLLFEEVKAQICRGDEEGGSFDWEMIAMIKCERAHDFYFSQAAVQAHVVEQLSDNDIILLSKEKFQEGSAVPGAYAFASVEGREGKQTLKFRLFLDGEFSGLNEKTLARSARLAKMRTAMQAANSAWWMMKVSNLSTIVREYTALQSISQLPFADVILTGQLKATHADLSDATSHVVPRKLMEFLEENHNESQIQAVKAGLTRNPVVLIQVSKPYHNLFTDESFASMKKMDMEESEEQKHDGVEKRALIDQDFDTAMDEVADFGGEELMEAAENFGDLDEDVEE